MRIVRRGMAVVLLLMGLVACGGGGLTVKDAWARSSPMNADTGALYFTIVNRSGQDDALVGVSTEVAATAELHRSHMEGDVMKMEPVPGGRVEVPAGQTVTFAPGGLHVMLMGLKAPLKAGSTFEVTLHFERAGDVTVTVEVRE